MITHSISRAATRMPSVRTSIAALIAGAAFVLPGAARADTTCSHDSDCSKGFTCVASPVSACPPIAPCPSGAACATPVDCTTSMVHTCQLAPCLTDDDCAPDMVCHADSYQECGSPGACAKTLADGGFMQVACPPPTCTTVTEPSACIPKYELPCKVNADCGDHFTCVPDTQTSCWASASGGGASGTGTGAGYPSSASSSSSAGTTVASPPIATSPPAEPAVDAGVITPPPLEAVDGGAAPTSGCTTTTLTTSSCVADSIVCTADSDCPATWTCEGYAISNGSNVTSNIACAQPALIVDGSPVTVPCEFDGGAAPPTPKTCQPPYGFYATPGTTSGAPGGLPLSASADGGVAATSGGGASGAGTSPSGSGANSAPPVTAPATPTESGSASSAAGNTMDGGGGCAIGSSPAGGAAGSLWTLVGLVGLAFRRRPRATR